MVKSGIIDPTMVTRSALQNAASIAKNILTTEAIVVDAPEKSGNGGGGMPDMGGMGGMMSTFGLCTTSERGRRLPAPFSLPTAFLVPRTQ